MLQWTVLEKHRVGCDWTLPSTRAGWSGKVEVCLWIPVGLRASYLLRDATDRRSYDVPLCVLENWCSCARQNMQMDRRARGAL